MAAAGNLVFNTTKELESRSSSDQELSFETERRNDGKDATVLRDRETGNVVYPTFVPPHPEDWQNQTKGVGSSASAGKEPEPPKPGEHPPKTHSDPLQRFSGDDEYFRPRPLGGQRGMTEAIPPREGSRRFSGMPGRLQRAGTNIPDMQRALWRGDHDDSSSSSSSSEDEVSQAQEEKKQKRVKKKLQKQKSDDPYRKFRVGNDNYHTKGKVKRDGRLSISVNDTSSTGYLAKAIGSAVKKVVPKSKETTSDNEDVDDYVSRPAGSRASSVTTVAMANVPCPKLNIVIMVIGSRGDAQPFLKIGQVLKQQYGHRVRIATHPAFKDFVEKDSGLEFFSVGGDPSELMAFMVKNPGMIPKLETVKAGDIGRRRAAMAEMFEGFWRACIHATDDPKDQDNLRLMGDKPPFIADAIIANPPSFAHYHIAEALGIPLHLMFTFPYTPTQAFPHPLASIKKSNVDPGYTNFISYPLVEMMVWQGLGDLVNDFRVKTLGLDPVSTLWAPGATYRLHVPFTYLWSPGLVPKPEDWGDEIDISGFVFLDLASSFKPPDDLVKFLDDGDPPIYIGFGSIVVDDPDRFTEMIFEAVKQAGVRALVSKGWGKLGGENVPDNVYMLENTPHDWLFPRVSACVIHGGAGTTAISLKCGKPTMVVPFFGDQHFWGSMLERCGAGPEPVPYKRLTAEKLAEGIKYCLSDEAKQAATEIARDIEKEGDGAENACKSFHKHLTLQGTHSMRCCVLEDRVAIWHLKHTNIRLSAIAAEVLASKNALSWRKLKLIRHREWNDFEGPGEPVTGLAGSLVTTVGDVVGGVGSVPMRIAKSSNKRRERKEKKEKRKARREAREKAQEANCQDTEAETEKDKKEDSSKSKPAQPSEKQTNSSEDTSSKTLATTSDSKEEKPKTAGKLAENGNQNSDNDKDNDKNGDELEGTEAQDHAQPSKEPPSQTPKRGANPHRESYASSLATTATTDTSEEPSRAHEFAQNVGKGVGKSAHALARAPVDMSLAVAQGFHNAPRLYGDDTVRRPLRVTGMRSGLRAARREFGYGVYDAFTGVVRLPVRGARDSGAKGFAKGVGMGMMGFVLKNFAAIAGPGAYTLKGVAKQLEKGRSPVKHLRRARIVQAHREWQSLDREGQQKLADRILDGWKVLQRLARALEEAERKQSGGIRGRLSARRRRGIGAAFESVEIAQRALTGIEQGQLEQVVEKGARRESDGRSKVERKVKREKKKQVAEHAGERRKEDEENSKRGSTEQSADDRSRRSGANDQEQGTSGQMTKIPENNKTDNDSGKSLDGKEDKNKDSNHIAFAEDPRTQDGSGELEKPAASKIAT
ncbi:hypothetical protein MCOR25_006907 [Pyricularia grisea]|nr:hypothetical protein MCOR25_006907 [Pyricularia grisea]